MDRLTPFFDRFTLSARVFYSGRLCGFSSNHETQKAGHLHVLKQGKLKIILENGLTRTIEEPSILFYPKPLRHQFQTDEKIGAELVCAWIEFGSGMLNPLVESLPDMMVLPLSSTKELEPTVGLLFSEAFGEYPARQVAVDRLAEYFLVLLLRSAMENKLLESGVLLGLADSRLSAAIHAMHQKPEHPWSLDELAELAGMSRARFAVNFRQIVGSTPFDYLTDWRIGMAQSLLKKGEPLKMVAPTVGYASSNALTRIFTQKIGIPPSEWLDRFYASVGTL